MKLYECHATPNPRRARIFLAEKGITLPLVEVNLIDGENLQPAFLAVNPRGLLPTLELDDGTRFDEVMAICRYFEELYPVPPLLGRTPVERALVESRQRRAEFDGMIAGSEVFRNQDPRFSRRSLPGAPGQTLPAIPELVTRGRQGITRFHDWLEETLQQSQFLVGDAYTMADITAQCAVDFHVWMDIRIPEANTRSRQWHAAVSSRPSAAA